MRAFIFTGLTAFALLGCSAADSVDPNGPIVTQADFESVVGEDWTGELTYLDYSSEKRVTIPAAATIKLAGSNGIKIRFPILKSRGKTPSPHSKPPNPAVSLTAIP